MSGSTIDWDRWHELRDIRDRRMFTPGEWREYWAFLPIVAALDADEVRVADAAMERLVKGHERVIDSMRRATRDLR